MKTSTAALIALATAVGFAPITQADTSADYLAILDQNKIVYSNATTAVNIGNTICQQLHNNVDPGNAAETALNAGYNADQAGRILYAASHALCPDTEAVVTKWGNSP